MVRRPLKSDLFDAIDHASDISNDFDSNEPLENFQLKYLGKLSVEQLEEYDDIFAWIEDIEDDEELQGFRGDDWAEIAQEWGDEPPPIVVVSSKSNTTIGDGRGRITYAAYKGIPVHTWELMHKSLINESFSKVRWQKLAGLLKEETDSHKPKTNVWYHGSEDFQGEIKPLYLSPNKSVSAMYGTVYQVTLSPDAKWLDTDKAEYFIPGMDSIGYSEGWAEKLKNKGYDVVWDSEDYRRGQEQIYVVNPDVVSTIKLV